MKELIVDANRDPLAQEGVLNIYAYCGNDPLNLIDILGLCDPSTWSLFWHNVAQNWEQKRVSPDSDFGLSTSRFEL